MNNQPDNSNLSRRRFLLRCSKAGLSAAAACSLGYAFFDPSGPKASQPKEDGVVFPDFAVAAPDSKMSIVRGADRKITIERAFEALGGMGAYIQKDDRVLLKVNAAFASPPVLGATSHPDLVEAVCRLCYKAGASDVIVSDNPINDPASSFALTGIGRAAEAAGARVAFPRETAFRPAMIPQTQLLQNWPILFEPFQKINKVTGSIRISECVLCMNCLDGCCPRNIMTYGIHPSAGGEVLFPNLARREFVTAFVAGTAAIPMLRLSGTTGSNWNAGLIRPPGALAETDFLARCIKCGQCMRVCPTNVIQPALFQFGAEALWTPVLNFRIGTSVCQLNCIACGNLCPTAAIRPIWDTAERYENGKSETGIGQYFSKYPQDRSKIFLVTKAKSRNPDKMSIALEESLKRLQTDYVDLYFLHAVSGGELNDSIRAWAQKAKAANKIRFFGVSTHRNMEKVLTEAAQVDWIDGIMMTYNYRIMNTPAMQAAVKACVDKGIGLTAMKPRPKDNGASQARRPRN